MKISKIQLAFQNVDDFIFRSKMGVNYRELIESSVTFYNTIDQNINADKSDFLKQINQLKENFARDETNIPQKVLDVIDGDYSREEMFNKLKEIEKLSYNAATYAFDSYIEEKVEEYFDKIDELKGSEKQKKIDNLFNRRSHRPSFFESKILQGDQLEYSYNGHKETREINLGEFEEIRDLLEENNISAFIDADNQMVISKINQKGKQKETIETYNVNFSNEVLQKYREKTNAFEKN